MQAVGGRGDIGLEVVRDSGYSKLQVFRMMGLTDKYKTNFTKLIGLMYQTHQG